MAGTLRRAVHSQSPRLILLAWLALASIHPVVFNQHGPQMAGSMLLTFCVVCAALLVLASTLYRIELAAKRIDGRLREVKELRA